MLFVKFAIVFVSLIFKIFQILLLVLEPEVVDLLVFEGEQLLPLLDGCYSFIILVLASPQLVGSLFFLTSNVVEPIQKHLMFLGLLL